MLHLLADGANAGKENRGKKKKKYVTKKPKLMEMMTVVAMEIAARSRSPRWPANA